MSQYPSPPGAHHQAPTPMDPYRQGPPMQGPPPKADGRAIASMVLGIVGIVLCCLPVVGLVCGTVAIVFYAKFTGDNNRSGQRLGGKGMAIAGLVTGIIAAALGLLYTLYWAVAGSLLMSLPRILGG